mgnify:CR=1 FL=1|tara:strand:- start:12603 stop:13490 length:888 start_codon:yes stop_codon:yes gene_type:complete
MITIKDLINEIIYDKLTLSQALNRAKLIAFELNNLDLIKWLQKELNGYTKNDILPNHRVISCEVVAIVNNFGQKEELPFDLTSLGEDLYKQIYKMKILSSVSIIESLLTKSSGIYAYENLPIGITQKLRQLSNEQSIVSVRRKIQFHQQEQILNLTKQKLLDTLFDLDKAFPDFQDIHKNTKENDRKTSTIITNHIYGENASSVTGVGDFLSQNITLNQQQKLDDIFSELKKLGVKNDDITEIKDITKSEKNKIKLSQKLMSWVTKVSSDVIAKELQSNVPSILSKAKELLEVFN